MLNIPFRLNSICFLFERTATIQAAEQNESRIKDRVALVFSISYEIVSDFLHPNLVEANKEGKHRSTHLDQYNNSSIGEYRSDWARNRFEDGKIKFKRKPKISLRKIYMKIIQDVFVLAPALISQRFCCSCWLVLSSTVWSSSSNNSIVYEFFAHRRCKIWVTHIMWRRAKTRQTSLDTYL